MKLGDMHTVPFKKALERRSMVDVERFYDTKDYKSRDQIL
jgi:hypothetical protein